MDDFEDKILNAAGIVIDNWGIVELIVFVIFFPWSLLYLCMRILQEYRKL